MNEREKTNVVAVNLGMRFTTALLVGFIVVAMTGNCSCLGLDRDYLGDVLDADDASDRDTCVIHEAEVRG